MNEVLRTIAQRYSCRAFDGRLPDRPQLEAIANAALQSPSALGRQPWEIVVITDKALLEELDAEGMLLLSQMEDKSAYDRFMARGGTLFYNAPCMYLVLQQADKGMDSGIVSQNISLAAASLGLGSCICGMAAVPFGGPKAEAFKKRIGFPEGYEFGISVLVGYAVGEGKPHEPDASKVRYM